MIFDIGEKSKEAVQLLRRIKEANEKLLTANNLL